MPSDSGKGFLRHFQACNACDLDKFTPFTIGDAQLGWIKKELAAVLPRAMDFFVSRPNGIALAPHLDHFSTRSEALAVAAAWVAQRYGANLRNEMYPIIRQWGDKPLAQIDRAAVPWFGVKGFGVHVNGFVRKPDGIHLWVSERAANRQIDPGKLDNLIGGGQPIGLSIEENLCKEAKEEAGIAAALAKTAKQVRPISYRIERHNGMRDDTLFVFDLELPEGYMPHNTDGEVASFELMPLEKVAALVRDTDKFKFNCNLVIIDFLVRHGFLTLAHGEYEKIISFLK